LVPIAKSTKIKEETLDDLRAATEPPARASGALTPSINLESVEIQFVVAGFAEKKIGWF
jgi:hypothetical protein